jgi:hypothetical protein
MLKWLRNSWRTALVAGVGALCSPTFASKTSASVPNNRSDGFVILKRENGALLISERGSPFQPLNLGDTSEAAELHNLFRKLSPDGSAVRVPIDRRIVADGGMGASKPLQKKQGRSSSGKR